VLLLAADTAADLNGLVAAHTALLGEHRLNLVFPQRGQVPDGLPSGHEHFGFKDGISQPGIIGVTVEPKPGQDLLQPGEFVLGYPTQPEPGGVPPAGPIAMSGPLWGKDGSYLVFRRLRQDVRAFNSFVANEAQRLGWHEDAVKACLVGRWPSGAPLIAGFDPNQEDPGKAKAALWDEDHVNGFGFQSDDWRGEGCPFAAHIRKVHPRDSEMFDSLRAKDVTSKHRLLRRGITFGETYQPGFPDNDVHGADPDFPNDRGLLFLCYQASIENQFEFVQSNWINNPGFPHVAPEDGHDPIASQRTTGRRFRLPITNMPASDLPPSWVVTTGGGYFFQPSLAALHGLAISGSS
jgi:Dyp-type peroxidase family